MPKRSRSGVVRRPVRVVAPTSVNGFRSSRIDWAPGPCPITRSMHPSSIAGYSSSSIERLSRWISSMNSTSWDSSAVRIAAMSALRSMAGPEATRSVRAHLDRDDAGQRRLAEARRAGEEHVLARLAAGLGGLQKDRELLLQLRLADELVQAMRAQRAVELLLAGGDQCVGQAMGGVDAHTRPASAARTRSEVGSSASTLRSESSASATDIPSPTSASRAAV